jgi:hypothetical protein
LRAGEEGRDGRRCTGTGELRPLDDCVDFLRDWINREVREMRWVKRGGWGGVEEGVLLADVGIERGGLQGRRRFGERFLRPRSISGGGAKGRGKRLSWAIYR